MADERKKTVKGYLNRRDVLKAMTALPAAALVPLSSASDRQMAQKPKSATAPAADSYQRKVFDEHQWQSVRTLSDLIIPADDRSGSATDAGVPEFIDDWLDFKGGRPKAQILGGLTWLDLECNRLFNHDFVDCPLAQQKQILDRIAYPKKAAPEEANAVAFFNELRDLVVSGFFSSKVGVNDLPYLGNQMVADWKGCPDEVIGKLGVKG
jgi:Gluconate 2-dehydrogenase subunit 3